MPRQPRSFAQRGALLWSARMTTVAAFLAIQLYYSTTLMPGAFGRYNGVFVQIGFWSALLPLGLPFVITLTPREAAAGMMARLVRRGLPAFLIIAACALGLSWQHFAGPGRSYSTAICAACTVIIVLCSGISVIGEGLLLRLGLDVQSAASQAVYALLLGTVHFIWMPVNTVVWLLLGWAIAALVRAAYVLWQVRRLDFAPPDPASLQLSTREWAWLAANESLETGARYLDKLVLLTMISQAAFGIYILGTYELPFITLLVSVSGMLFNAGAADAKTGDAWGTFGKNALLLACFVFPLAGLFFFSADALFDLPIFRSRYAAAAPLFQIAALIIPVRVAYHASLLQLIKRNRVILFGSLFSFALYLALLWPLYGWLGLVGVVWANVAGSYFQMLYYWAVTARLYRKPLPDLLPFGRLAIVLIISALLTGIAGLLPIGNAYLKLVAVGAAALGAAMVCLRLIYRKYRPGSVADFPAAGIDAAIAADADRLTNL